MKKVISIIVIIAILCSSLFLGYKYLQNKQKEELNELQSLYDNAINQISDLKTENDELKNPPRIDVTVKTLKEYIVPASELITYKYYYTDTGEYEKDKKLGKSDISIPFTKDKTIYVYSGVISAGIDTEEIKFAVDNEKRKIVIAMPQPKIIAHELDEDSFKSYDVKNSVFTTSSLEDFADFQKILKETQEDSLNSKSEFWDSVKGNAENVISRLITANEGMNEFDLEYSWTDK